MMYFKISVTAFMLFLTNIYSQQGSKFTLHAHTLPFDLGKFFVLNRPIVEPTTKIGFHFYPTEKFGVEIESGLFTNTGHKEDLVTNTDETPEYRAFYLGFAPIVRIINNDKASLSIFGKVGLSFIKWSDSDFSGTMDHYETYSVMLPSIFVGFEPSVYLNENIAMYSNFGLKIQFIPNSKEIDTSSPLYNPSANSYPLVEVKDGSTSMFTEAVSLGIRFHF